MRSLKFVFLALSVPFLMGSATEETTLVKGLKPGSLAPEINLQDISLTGDGKYVLLQFWAAYDGKSRAENVLMYNEISNLKTNNLQLVSISFDEKESIFNETVKTDGLDSMTQFNVVQGRQSDIFKEYQLENGFGNLLINPEGVILAKNIAPKELASMELN